MGINNENKLTAHLNETKSSNELKMGNTVDTMMHKPTSNEESKSSPQLGHLEASLLFHWYYGLFGAEVFIHKLVLSKHRAVMV